MTTTTTTPCCADATLYHNTGTPFCALHAAAPALLAVLERLLNEGSYDDNGDYVLLRPGDEDQDGDYEDPPSIAAARALLRTLDA